jgi:R3H domain
VKLIPKIEINTDLFLHNCSSALAARRKKDGTFNSHIRYEPFLFQNYNVPNFSVGTPTSVVFKNELEKIIKHHSAHTPQARKKENINEENIAHFSLIFASLFADTQDICLKFMGIQIPSIPNHDTVIPEFDSAKDSLVSQLILKYELYQKEKHSLPNHQPFTPYDSVEIQLQVAAEFWEYFADLIYAHLPDYSPAILSFAAWEFQTSPQEEQIDWKIRPPVGEAFQKFQRSFGRGNGREPFKTSGGRPGNKPEQLQPNHKPKEHKKFEGRGLGNSKFESLKQTDTSRARTDTNKQDPDMHLALNEVHEAILRLKNETNLESVTLTPRNSFIRKQQHSLAQTLSAENGIISESSGEAKERCVVLKRQME